MGGAQVQSAPAYQNRNEAFGDGHQMGGPTVSPGLAQDQQKMNGQPAVVHPATSLNGMSQGQYSATMGGSLATENGMAAGQYEQSKWGMRRPD
jgi:hypothetical protein